MIHYYPGSAVRYEYVAISTNTKDRNNTQIPNAQRKYNNTMEVRKVKVDEAKLNEAQPIA